MQGKKGWKKPKGTTKRCAFSHSSGGGFVMRSAHRASCGTQCITSPERHNLPGGHISTGAIPSCKCSAGEGLGGSTRPLLRRPRVPYRDTGNQQTKTPSAWRGKGGERLKRLFGEIAISRSHRRHRRIGFGDYFLTSNSASIASSSSALLDVGGSPPGTSCIG